MIPIKKINIDDLEFKDGRYVYTFTADEDMESIDLESSCFGDTTINYLQVEKNPDMTYFVPPEVYEGNISGIFKDLKELNIEMTDTENSDLWGRIKINAQGMIEEWHNDVTSVEIAKTADGIAGKLSTLDDRLTTEISISAKGLQTKIEDVEKGLISQLTSTASRLDSRMNDTNANYSRLTQTVAGVDTQVGNLRNDMNSQLTILKNQIASTVTASDVRSIIQQSYDSIRLAVEDRLDGNKLKSAINLSTNGV
ncbi:gp58-like family protein [Dolosicoccus paucivorans]|uniref:gp58-like family protein n=1 Tax=Dolosicoccus paucivorans TaxID=84521 RepID=UPI00087F0C32|nr:gp58-like family protein [Dolosicoccus paucivorans]SDI41368.1 gp58-like protein [Dolosicoccus paucivorans]